MIFLTLDELLHVARRTLGDAQVEVRDAGLLQSALARPQTSVLGDDAYPTLEAKAAALVHSLTKNDALVDGNKRLALAGLFAFLGMNGRALTFSNAEAYDFIMAIAAGDLTEIKDIADVILTHTEAFLERE